MSISQRYIENYFKRFADTNELIKTPIDPNCRIIVVIPCHNEPDLIGTLGSLLECTQATSKVEIIIVVNEKLENNKQESHKQNLRTISDFNQWKSTLKDNHIKFHLIEVLRMPQKQAGVGLARKIGMDEALKRFVSIDTNGTIVCLDADCRVSSNYFEAIDQEFVKTEAGLGEVHYEHPYELEKDEDLKKGIINYELFLRYYVEGLKFAGFPYAIQTIGSCMLVKAGVYAKHGGMNKRKAGEDFYFLHKIIPHEIFKEVKSGTVYPSCRVSDRVPFGTGKAQQDWLDQESESYLTYDPVIFSQLRALIETAHRFYVHNIEETIGHLPEIPQAFISTFSFASKIQLIKSNCKTSDQFQKQFFTWFDGFLCMKFVHFVRDKYFPNIPIKKAVEKSNFLWDTRTQVLIDLI